MEDSYVCRTTIERYRQYESRRRDRLGAHATSPPDISHLEEYRQEDFNH